MSHKLSRIYRSCSQQRIMSLVFSNYPTNYTCRLDRSSNDNIIVAVLEHDHDAIVFSNSYFMNVFIN
jgi:hypothetical protein